MDPISHIENENIKQKRPLKCERKKNLEADGTRMKVETKRRFCDNCGKSLAG